MITKNILLDRARNVDYSAYCLLSEMGECFCDGDKIYIGIDSSSWAIQELQNRDYYRQLVEELADGYRCVFFYK